MENDAAIDLSLGNIWKTWFAFRKGKKSTSELDAFQYHLEKNLFELFLALRRGNYQHGPYRKFVVADNKKRDISVAGIHDRLIHRLLYDYLVPLYDKTFEYDAWSCRKGKGVTGAIERIQRFLRSVHGFIWKGDIRKFFDNVSHTVLLKILSRKIKDKKAFWLLRGVIQSFERERERVSGAFPLAISQARFSPISISMNLIVS